MCILADSGILLRLYEPTDPLHLLIRSAVDFLDARDDVLLTAPQNIAEFWNVCTRPTTARGGLGMTIQATEQRLQIIEKKFSLLTEPPQTYSIWRDLVTSLSVKGKQVHDARLVALMKAHGITHIITLNVNDFLRYPGITVIDPATVSIP